MSAADTGVHPIIESGAAILRPPARRPANGPDRRTLVVRQILAVVGSTRWASPPPGVSLRQVLVRVLLTTVGLALVLLWSGR